jgi:alkanesulfonate monooxygenase SsuD/methylene tetrahydromethanopterin reductase-like flavin-dependent oxidoreductase (luciferase family)
MRKNPPLRLGFFTQPVHPPTRQYGEVLREDREAVALADRLGYVEAFVGEHFTDAAEPITSSLAFIASLAERCPSITFGTGVLSLPSYHPAMVAAQVAMLDHLLEGRFLLGIGSGVPSDAEALGNLGIDRDRKLYESVDQVLALWSEEPPYRLEGEFYRITTEQTLTREIGQGVMVRPFQRPHPPIVVTSIRPDSRGPETAGQRGWGGISASYVPAEWARAHRERYLAARERAGLDPDPRGWRIARSIFVADDEATALGYAKSLDGPHAFYFYNVLTKFAGARALGSGQPPRPVSSDQVAGALESLVVAGDVPQVVGQILELRETVGAFETLLYTGHDWMDASLGRRSMELMASEVLPRVNAALAVRGRVG